MAITNFIPTVWSETLYQSLDQQYVGVAHCSREFEGEIKNIGSKVNICGVGDITVGDYTKNTDMSNPQTLSDTVRTLTISQAKYFNFQIDDIDRAQASPRLMNAAMSNAARALAAEADRFIFGLYGKATHVLTKEYISTTDILDVIVNAKQKLMEMGVADTTEVVLEVSPAVASILQRAKLSTSIVSDNTSALESGSLGSILGCKIFVSPNIAQESGSGQMMHKCMMRTKRAIAFAEQLSEIDAYRPEKRFADAVKGLHLYGAELIYPDELIVLDLGIETTY